ncbi:hypothetical protein K493DRAFT_197704, partial [Basidiobolus meristosporus CBS 931.73]
NQKLNHFQCPVCKKTFGRRDNYKRHFRIHSGEYPHICPVPGCNKGFTRSDQISRHL